MSYYKAGIIAAITELKDRTGSSSIAIKKHMKANLPKHKKWLNGMFFQALKQAVADGDLIRIKNSYKIKDTTTNIRMDEFNDGLISAVASFLPGRDMARLSSTCRRLGRAEDVTVRERRRVARDVQRRRILGRDGHADEEDDRTRRCSLIERAARYRTLSTWSEEERGLLPRKYGESWIHLAHQLELLRAPLSFDRYHDHYHRLRDNNPAHIEARRLYHGSNGCSCGQIMRTGRHYATFTMTIPGQLQVGVIRPGWDMKKKPADPVNHTPYNVFCENMIGAEYEGNVHCCMYCFSTGHCCPGRDDLTGPLPSHWRNMEKSSAGDSIGLLLDLNAGSMTVYKNGRRLGVMRTGLAGEYRWGISIWNGPIFLPTGEEIWDHDQPHCAVHIKRSDAPSL